MRTTSLGSLSISVIGLGCNTFGRNIGLEEATRVVEAALESGINFFDTADRYGSGTSESILSAALKSRIDECVIATKFGYPIEGVAGSGGASPAYVRSAVERSLRQLNRSWIDLYQIHTPDPSVPIEETIGALIEIRAEGKIREFGCSNFTPTQLAEAAATGDRLGLPVVSTQVEYSLVNREIETSGLAAAAKRHNVAILPYRPLAKGLLSGRMSRGDAPTSQLTNPRYSRFLTNESFDVVDSLMRLSDELGRTPVEVALGWLLTRNNVAAVFPGATKPDQVRTNARAGSWLISEAERAMLEGLVPAV